MLRNILRTSRCLARRSINNFAPVLSRQYTCTTTFTCRNLHDSRKLLSTTSSTEIIEPAVFEEICNETLESLCEYFEELVDLNASLKGADVTYSDGVLTVSLGTHGTYVINRQSPNKQIWLSSPVSGPKRYDLIQKNGGYWIYKHDGVTLHKLLQEEISNIIKSTVDFKQCAHSFL